MADATSGVGVAMGAGLHAAVPAAAASFTASAASSSRDPTSPLSPSSAASAGAASSARGTGAVRAGAVAAACALPSSPPPALPSSPPDAAGSFLPSAALYIAPSTLPDAGSGLFSRTGEIFQYICHTCSRRSLPYVGQVMQRRDRTYIICTGSLNSHIDAAEHTHVFARYINDNAGCMLNACFVKYPREKAAAKVLRGMKVTAASLSVWRVLVRSTRAIAAGGEIFASYGQGYWRAKEKNGMHMQTSFAGPIVSPPTATADLSKPPHYSAVEPLPSEEAGKQTEQRQVEKDQVKQQQAEGRDAALLQAQQPRA